MLKYDKILDVIEEDIAEVWTKLMYKKYPSRYVHGQKLETIEEGDESAHSPHGVNEEFWKALENGIDLTINDHETRSTHSHQSNKAIRNYDSRSSSSREQNQVNEPRLSYFQQISIALERNSRVIIASITVCLVIASYFYN